MKHLTFIILNLLIPLSCFSQVVFSYKPVKQKVAEIYPILLAHPEKNETAFMCTDLTTAFHTIRLNRLPDTVAMEVKKLKEGEYTKPLYVGETCYIIKLNKRKAFGFYDLVIVFFAPRRTPKAFKINELKKYHEDHP